MVNFNRQALSAALTAGINQLDFVISEQQIAQLLDFLALLVKWNGVYNLTAIREPEQMITHHLLDTLEWSLQSDRDPRTGTNDYTSFARYAGRVTSI